MSDGDRLFAVLRKLRDEHRHPIVQPDLACSIRIMTLVVVATGLVSEARSKIVSGVIVSTVGVSARRRRP